MGDSGTASDLQYPCGQRVTGLHLSHFQPPATVTGLQFLDVEDSVASGCGVWWLALQDIVFLALAGGNVFHVFPCVYRTEGTECSPWQGSWFDRAQPSVPGPSSRSNLEMEPQVQYGLGVGGAQHPCSLQQEGVSKSSVVQPGWRLRSRRRDFCSLGGVEEGVVRFGWWLPICAPSHNTRMFVDHGPSSVYSTSVFSSTEP